MGRALLALIAILMWAGPWHGGWGGPWGGARAADLLSPPAFTAVMAREISAALPSAKVAVTGVLQLETRIPGGEAISNDLRNAYRRYVRDPEHLDEIVRQRVAGLVESVRDAQIKPPLDRSRIVPVIKTNAWAETIRQQRKAAPDLQLLTEPFNNELTIVYAEDRSASMRFLMMNDDVGDRSKLRELAVANLHRLLPKIEMREAASGIFLISAGGDYEASLLLADSIWSGGDIKVDGDIVVAVPAKNALLVTGSHNAAGLARLRALAADIVAGAYGLTSTLFVYREGKFVKFDG
jgi:uncharacterized protein YtpQ (UPF0354 family)